MLYYNTYSYVCRLSFDVTSLTTEIITSFWLRSDDHTIA